jgi:hypothetical protein
VTGRRRRIQAGRSGTVVVVTLVRRLHRATTRDGVTMDRRITGRLATVLFVVASIACFAAFPTATGAAGDQQATVGTRGTAGTASSPAFQLGPGEALGPGGTLVSPDGQVILTMQFDGNLVAYAGVDGANRVLWASGTAGQSSAYAVMQADGNLVVCSSTGSALWSSGTAGHPGAAVAVQDDGNVVVYGSDGAPVWSSGTALGFVGPDVGPVLASGQDLLPGEFLQSPNGQYRLYETPEGAPALYQQDADRLWWLMEGSDSLDPVPGVPTFFSCALCTESASVRPGSFLTLQGDGNLVLYPSGGGAAEWSAGTAGSGAVGLRLQDDGNLVLYGGPDPAGQVPAVWQTGTELFRGTVLGDGVTLGPGQFILSPDGAFELVMQDDGNLVVYGADRAGALWASRTSGDRGTFVDMQDDGNLVVYGGGATGADRPDATGSSGPGSGDVADWASGTAAPGADPDVTYATVATPYVGWLSETEAQADQAAQQARTAAAAFEAAFAGTVPPPLVAANRAQLLSLVATNVFGQDTPAIAAAEAQYGEMWAQDAAAMEGYAAASSTADPLPLVALSDAS